MVGTHAHTSINHRFTCTHRQTQSHLHTCEHTVGSYAHTNTQHRFTCIHIQTHSRSTHTDTLRFAESHIGQPLQTPPSSSPSLAPRGPALWLVPPFSPSLPSAPHQAKNRLTHCSSRGNRHGHLSPNLTQSLGLTSPWKWEHQSTPCKTSKTLIQHGGDNTSGVAVRTPKTEPQRE